MNDMSRVDPKLSAKTVTKRNKLTITHTNLTLCQEKAILTAVKEDNIVSKHYIGFNNLSGLDLGLLAKTLKNLKELNVIGSKLTK